MKPTRIVFDLGAVLFSWQPRRMLMRELPHVVPDEATAAHWEAQVFQGYGGDWGEFDRGTVEVPALVQRIARRTGFAAADVQRVVDAVPRELQPIPETVALLHQLADAGHTLHYLSNMPAPYAEILERQPFFERFASGVFSARVHHNKPEAAIFQVAVQRFGVPAQHLLFIDDHLPNVLAAKAQGWQAIQFLGAADARLQLQALGVLEGSGPASVSRV
jgi:putative hydrolase of the HAD superfamily